MQRSYLWASKWEIGDFKPLHLGSVTAPEALLPWSYLPPAPACSFLALWASLLSPEHVGVLAFPSFTLLSSTGHYLRPCSHPLPHESRGGTVTFTAPSPAPYMFK